MNGSHTPGDATWLRVTFNLRSLAVKPIQQDARMRKEFCDALLAEMGCSESNETARLYSVLSNHLVCHQCIDTLTHTDTILNLSSTSSAVQLSRRPPSAV